MPTNNYNWMRNTEDSRNRDNNSEREPSWMNRGKERQDFGTITYNGKQYSVDYNNYITYTLRDNERYNISHGSEPLIPFTIDNEFGYVTRDDKYLITRNRYNPQIYYEIKVTQLLHCSTEYINDYTTTQNSNSSNTADPYFELSNVRRENSELKSNVDTLSERLRTLELQLNVPIHSPVPLPSPSPSPSSSMITHPNRNLDTIISPNHQQLNRSNTTVNVNDLNMYINNKITSSTVEDFIFPIHENTWTKAQYLQFAKNVYTPQLGKYTSNHRQYMESFVGILIKKYEYNIYLVNSNYFNFTKNKKKLKRVLLVDVDRDVHTKYEIKFMLCSSDTEYSSRMTKGELLSLLATTIHEKYNYYDIIDNFYAVYVAKNVDPLFWCDKTITH